MELIAISSYEDESSEDGSIEPPARAGFFSGDDEVASRDESNRPGSEPEEEEKEEEEEEEEEVFEAEHLHSPVRVDPRNPLGPGLGPGIDLVRIDNMPSLSSVYTLYAEELVRAISQVNFMATRLDKTELKIVKLTSEVETLKKKLDRQVEISQEMTEETGNARGPEKTTGNKIAMLHDQLERERNKNDAEILFLKEENEKLKTAGWTSFGGRSRR
ncbi:hypothetical protein AALP_AAs51542U000200 [Arabis alpina]|uniref:Uncharacterized protein n=1 Tax=Arabis alpina TaxID=50452 RepID=A0A087FZY9_ARAAL|nr:hypothetical protein AALP_AAs51542U000200 [Arabis alpina]